MNDDIRRALDDLVGTPPATLGRRGAVMRRIERTRARRKLATRAALSAVLVASFAMGATRVITATPTGQTSLIEQPAEPEPSATKPAKPAQPEKKKAKPETKPVQPKPTAEPTYAPKPEQPKPTYAPKPAEPDPTYSEKPAPKPTVSEKPAAAGLAIELWPYTAAVAGQSMEWKVKAYDGAGRLLRVELTFGDGKSTVWEPSDGCGDGVAVKKLFPHTYAAAGTYTAQVTVTTGGCGAATETKVTKTSVKVTAAESGNGPAKPTVSAEKQVEAQLAKLLLHGADADGFVKKFWVDWGDGSPETYVGPRSLDSCVPGEGSSWHPTASHEYAAAGSYTVTVTVMSTSCDGGQGQTATVTLTVTV